MIDLNKFKNKKGNEANRTQITQIGVLEVVDAYLDGTCKDFTEEQVKRMVSNNITKIGIFETVATGTETEDNEGTDTPTETPTEPEGTDTEPKPTEGEDDIEVDA